MRAAVAAAVLAAAMGVAGSAQQTGTFALAGGTAQIVSKFWTLHGPGEKYTLFVQQFAKDGSPIKAYDVDMQHFMHMVIVRDDFATFAHKHPAFNTGTGAFQSDFTKEPNHRYYVYADSMPQGIGQQVFRFAMESDGAAKPVKLPATASAPNSKAGPYTITLAKTTFPANAPQSVDLTVEQDDDPAEDLVPYLGAPAHVVLINTKTLQYVHVHPMLRGEKMAMASHGAMPKMSGMVGSNKAGPFMKLDLPALAPGVYAAWVQVSGGKDLKVYTAPFTIVVR